MGTTTENSHIILKPFRRKYYYNLVFEMNPTTGASKLHSKKMYNSKFICKIIQEFEPAS